MSSFRLGWLGVLALTLTLSCDEAGPSVDAYIASVRTAQAPENEDADAKATREAIAQSRKVTIDNFAEHPNSSTGCYWGTLTKPDGKDVDIRFFVTRSEGGVWSVARASLTHHCQCTRSITACYMDK